MIDSPPLVIFFTWVPALIGAGILATLALFSLISIREGERRAAWVSLGIAALLPLPFLLVGVWRSAAQPVFAMLLVVATAILFLAPIGRSAHKEATPRTRIDERDIMFTRWRLEPGSPEHQEYYARRPEKKKPDDRIRAAPGLLKHNSKLYHPLTFRAAEASFAVIGPLQQIVDGAVALEQLPVRPEEMTAFIKGLALHYGAAGVGIAELHDYHVYTHIGRGAGLYGAPVELDHRFGIALTVEMNHPMLGQAPAGPAVMETAKQYLSAATVALQLATFIRSLGYPARAHIDGNYRVICPLVARDAGLGEIGRMGLLMTPKLGPRVRIAVVTTDLPLAPDQPTRDPTVIDFCRRCLKCAENCPSRSIPFGEQQMIDGAERWQIDSETCFLYWNTVGTDCGRCVAVCPYSHPDNVLHGLVRWGVERSVIWRWLALWADDLFYGRRPALPSGPGWLNGV